MQEPEGSMHLSNAAELARLQQLARPRSDERLDKLATEHAGSGLLASTERLKQGVSIEEQAEERQRIEESREHDSIISEQDTLLRIRQSLSSTLNDPTLVEDTSTWLWESATDMYDYWTSTDTAVLPVTESVQVEVSDFDDYLERMAPFRAFFAQNAVELDQYEQQQALLPEAAPEDSHEQFLSEMLSDRVSLEQSKAQAEALQQCFQRVPSVYLQSPSQFEVAQSGVFEVAFGSPAGAEDEMNQLKRCHKAVEKQLLVQISAKFGAFFGLQHDLQELEAQTAQGAAVVQSMRAGLASVRGDTVGTAASISEMMAKRRNLQALSEQLTLVQTVKQNQETLEAQLGCSDFAGAFSLSTQSAALVRDQLLGVRCLQNVVLKISALSEQVHHQMAADFVQIGLGFSSAAEEQRSVLKSLLLGGGGPGALLKLKPAALAQLRSCAQGILANPAGDRSDDLSWLASVTHEEFVGLLRRLLEAVLPLLHSLEELRRFGVGVMGQESAVAAGLGQLVQAGVDESHKRCARVLGARAKQLSTLALQEFHRVYAMAMHFAGQCEKLGEGTQPGFSLKGAVLSHAKTLVDGLHRNKMDKLAALLEQESWEQAEVHPRWQAVVDQLGVAPGSASEGPMEAQPTRTLSVDGKQYRVCASLLMLLEMLAEYLSCADKLPALCTDIVQRVGELLKSYNSRTCQLVLGAGAMQLAGLKSITARHLVLTSQCLSVMLCKIPAVRAHLAKYMPARYEPLLVELDRIGKELLEHRSEIYTKIVHILKERIDFWCNSVRADKSWLQHPEPAEFIKGIVSDSTKLFKVLMQYLPAEQLKLILQQIASLLNGHLVSQLSALDLSNPQLCTHLQADIAHLISSLEALKGFNTQFVELREFAQTKINARCAQPGGK